MTFKEALTQLKNGGTAAKPVTFAYVEKDKTGKPAFFVGSTSVVDSQKAATGVSGAKTSSGTMSVGPDNGLVLKTRGTAQGTLVAAVGKAGATSAFKTVTLGTPPANPGWQKGDANTAAQGSGINLGAQRNAAPDGNVYDTLSNADVSPAQGNVYDTLSNSDVSPAQGNVYDTLSNLQASVTPPQNEGENEKFYSETNAQAEQAAEAKRKEPAKKYPDVLRQSPAMAKLLDQREALSQKLAAAQSNPNTSPQALEAAAAMLAGMENQLDEAQKKLNDTGFVPKQIGAEYAGEHEKVGWRANDPDPVRQAQIGETATTVTKKYTDEEKKQSEMLVGADGLLRDPQGNLVNSGGRMEYVMDAKDGKLHQFTQKRAFSGETVKDVDGNDVGQMEVVHHSSVLGGEEVAGAGGIRVANGEIQKITNVSGHYKPEIGQTVQTVETLLKQGALLKKDWVDKDGQPLSGKVADLYAKTKAMQQQLEAKLQADPNADVAGDRASIDKAMAYLGKLGAGPRNAISDAEVGMIEVKEGMTGAQVTRTATSVNLPVKDFLSTGGGNQEQANRKKTMQEELVGATASKRADLDANFIAKDSERVADPTEAQMQQAEDDLDSRTTPQTRPRADASADLSSRPRVNPAPNVNAAQNNAEVEVEERPGGNYNAEGESNTAERPGGNYNAEGESNTEERPGSNYNA